MATITLTATAKQSQRIQEARAAYNAATGDSLTVRDWCYMVLREAVQNALAEQQETAAQAVRTVIDDDMKGGT